MDETQTDSMIGMSDEDGSTGGGEEATCDDSNTGSNGNESEAVQEGEQQNHDSSSNDHHAVNNTLEDNVEINPVTANNLHDLPLAMVASTHKRYMQVEGFDGRRNDIVYCRPLTSAIVNNDAANSSLESDADAQSTGNENDRPKLMLFFGGDIQVKK